MPRVKGKTKKIAYDILGVPANMRKNKTKNSRKVKERLNFEETRFVR